MKKILLVEDESLMLHAIKLKLQEDGYEVICCIDGKDALEQINTHVFDLVIMDIILPYVSGLELLGIIKSKAPTPVIMLTVMGQEKTVEEAFDLGADDYLNKPFNFKELAVRIKRLVK